MPYWFFVVTTSCSVVEEIVSSGGVSTPTIVIITTVLNGTLALVMDIVSDVLVATTFVTVMVMAEGELTWMFELLKVLRIEFREVIPYLAVLFRIPLQLFANPRKITLLPAGKVWANVNDSVRLPLLLVCEVKFQVQGDKKPG